MFWDDFTESVNLSVIELMFQINQRETHILWQKSDCI